MPNPPLPKTFREQALEFEERARHEKDPAFKKLYLDMAKYLYKKNAKSQSPPKPQQQGPTTMINISHSKGFNVGGEGSFEGANIDINIGDNFNFEDFKVQVNQLINELMPLAKTDEQRKGIEGLYLAKSAADEKDPSRIKKALKTMGKGAKWVLEKAEDIGTDIVKDLIKQQLGLNP